MGSLDIRRLLHDGVVADLHLFVFREGPAEQKFLRLDLPLEIHPQPNRAERPGVAELDGLQELLPAE
jgi:hypothetical protein